MSDNLSAYDQVVRSRSTATEVQIAKLVALVSQRPHHTHELRQLGISHPAGRVHDLEKRGYVFGSHRITTVGSDGFSHHGVAMYSLLQTPEEANHVGR